MSLHKLSVFFIVFVLLHLSSAMAQSNRFNYIVEINPIGNISSGSPVTITGSICKVRNNDRRDPSRCQRIRDNEINIIATFPDSSTDVSDQLVYSNEGRKQLFSYTSGNISADDLNRFSITIGQLTPRLRLLSRIRDALLIRINRLEKQIQRLENKGVNPFIINLLTTLKDGLIEAANNIKDEIDASAGDNIIADQSIPLQVDNNTSASLDFSSLLRGFKLSIMTDNGVIMEGDNTDLRGAITKIEDTNDRGRSYFAEFHYKGSLVHKTQEQDLNVNDKFEYSFNTGALRPSDNRNFEVKLFSVRRGRTDLVAEISREVPQVLADDQSPQWVDITFPTQEKSYLNGDLEIDLAIEDNFGRVNPNSISASIVGQTFSGESVNQDIFSQLSLAAPGDGQYYNITGSIAGLDEGSYKLILSGEDFSQNKATPDPLEFDFVIDRTAPSITLNQQDNQIINNSNFNLQVLIDDNSLLENKVFFNGNEIALADNSLGSFSVELNLQEGTNRIEVISVDASGNSSSQKLNSITLDTIAPVLTINSPQEGQAFSSLSVDIEGQSNEALASITANGLNLSEQTGFSGQIQLSGEGAHAITIEGTDLAGNKTTVVRNIVIDQSAPQIATNFQGGIYTNIENQTINVTITDALETQTTIKLNGSEISSGADKNIQAIFNLNEGTNSIEIISSDSAGNTSGPFVISNVVLDTILPIVEVDLEGNQITSNEKINLPIKITDVNPEKVEIYQNDNLVETSTEIDFTYEAKLVEGENNFKIVAYDKATNSSTPVEINKITQDTEGPNVAFNPPGGIFDRGDFNITINVFDESGIDYNSLSLILNDQVVESSKFILNQELGQISISITEEDIPLTANYFYIGLSISDQLGNIRLISAGFNINSERVTVGNTFNSFSPSIHGSCMVLDGGKVKCWGSNVVFGTFPLGILGYGTDIYDGNTPDLNPYVDIGGNAKDVVVSLTRACALLEDGGVTCWGANAMGLYGQNPSSGTIGDDETPSSFGTLAFPKPVKFLAIDDYNGPCVVMEGNEFGCTNQGRWVGDLVGQTILPSPVVKLDGSTFISCLLMENGKIRCNGNQNFIVPTNSSVTMNQDILNETFLDFALGTTHICAIRENGNPICWGVNEGGRLGVGPGYSTTSFSPVFIDQVPELDFGKRATQIIVGNEESCALFEDGSVHCWGKGNFGQLGNGSVENIGDDEIASSAPALNIGEPVKRLFSMNGGVNCYESFNGQVKCWGLGLSAGHGYGATVGDLGDDEELIDIPYLNLGNTPAPSLIADFTPDKFFGPVPLTINFDASLSESVNGFITSYEWNFGDNSPAVVTFNPSVSHTFQDFGAFVIKLNVMDNLGNTAEFEQIISVTLPLGPPIANFDCDVIDKKLQCNYRSYDQSGGSLAASEWNWGDGNIEPIDFQEISDPWSHVFEHTYENNGVYNVVLKVTDNRGAVSTFGKFFTINADEPLLPLAAFDYQVKQGLSVDFDASGSLAEGRQLSKIEWSFGDGNNALSEAPNLTTFQSHTYTSSGQYTVNLKVIDLQGNIDSIFKTINVSSDSLNIKPVANFAYNITEPFTVTFDGKIFGSFDYDGKIVKYYWEISDGTIRETEIFPSFTHNFQASGTYDVSLVVQDDYGDLSDKLTRQIIITDTGTAPLALFSCSNIGNLVTRCGAHSLHDGITYIKRAKWEWGDGTEDIVENTPISSDNGPIPSLLANYFKDHQYAADGQYTIRLTLTDSNNVTHAREEVVSVSGINIIPLADFFCYKQNGNVTLCKAFHSKDPDGNIVSYQWNWGDGNIEDGFAWHPHYYEQPGTYPITLTVTDNLGATASKTINFEYTSPQDIPPTADFYCQVGYFGNSPYLNCEGEISFSSESFITNFEWSINPQIEGYPFTQTSIQYFPQVSGSYDITLTVTDLVGRTSSQTKSFSIMTPINDPPIISFNCFKSQLDEISCPATIVDPNGDQLTSYEWDWGDGNIESGSIQYNEYGGVIPPFGEHFYKNPGVFRIKLSAFDETGKRGTLGKFVEIDYANNIPPVADFYFNVQNNYYPVVVEFSDNSSDSDTAIVSRKWELSTGEVIDNQTEFRRDFTQSGSLDVKLTVTDTVGATSSITKTIDITVNSTPQAAFTCEEKANFELHCDAGLSYSPSSEITSYTWQFSEGANQEGVSIVKQFSQEGSYDITLTVINSKGESSSITNTIELEGVPESSTGSFQLASHDQNKYLPVADSIRFVPVGMSILMSATDPTKPEVLEVRNDYDIVSDELITVSQNELIINSSLKDGQNNITIYTKDQDGKEVNFEMTLYAGSRTITAYPKDDGLDDISSGMSLISVIGESFQVQEEITSNTVIFSNVPKGALVISGVSNDLLGYIALEEDSSEESDLILYSMKVADTEENNDFSNGLTGWEILEGSASLEDHVAEQDFYENVPQTKKNMRVSPNENGLLKLRRTFKSSQAAGTLAKLLFKVFISTANDYYILSMRGKNSGNTAVFHNVAGNLYKYDRGGINSSLWIDESLPVNSDNEEIEMVLTVKNYQAQTAMSEKLFSLMGIESAFAQVFPLDAYGTLLSGIYLKLFDIKSAKLYGVLGRELQSISLGVLDDNTIFKDSSGIPYNPITLKNLELVGDGAFQSIRSLVLRITSYEGSNFSQINVPGTWVDPNINSTQVNFRIPNNVELGERVAVHLDVDAGVFGFSSYLLRDRSTKKSYYNVLTSLRVDAPLAGRFPSNKNRDEAKGGDTYIRNSYKNYFTNFFGQVFDLQGQTRPLIYNDASRLNGGYFYPHSEHQRGQSIDLAFYDHLTDRTKGYQFKDEAEGVIEVLSLSGTGEFIKKLLITYPPETSEFHKRIQYECLPDGRLAREVIKNDQDKKEHDDHFHITFTDPKNKDGFSPESLFISTNQRPLVSDIGDLRQGKDRQFFSRYFKEIGLAKYEFIGGEPGVTYEFYYKQNLYETDVIPPGENIEDYYNKPYELVTADTPVRLLPDKKTIEIDEYTESHNRNYTIYNIMVLAIKELNEDKDKNGKKDLACSSFEAEHSILPYLESGERIKNGAQGNYFYSKGGCLNAFTSINKYEFINPYNETFSKDINRTYDLSFSGNHTRMNFTGTVDYTFEDHDIIKDILNLPVHGFIYNSGNSIFFDHDFEQWSDPNYPDLTGVPIGRGASLYFYGDYFYGDIYNSCRTSGIWFGPEDLNVGLKSNNGAIWNVDPRN